MGRLLTVPQFYKWLRKTLDRNQLINSPLSMGYYILPVSPLKSDLVWLKEPHKVFPTCRY